MARHSSGLHRPGLYADALFLHTCLLGLPWRGTGLALLVLQVPLLQPVLLRGAAQQAAPLDPGGGGLLPQLWGARHPGLCQELPARVGGQHGGCALGSCCACCAVLEKWGLLARTWQMPACSPTLPLVDPLPSHQPLHLRPVEPAQQLLTNRPSHPNLYGRVQERTILQFGKVAGDAFTMDYSYPMTALQASSRPRAPAALLLPRNRARSA